MKITDLVLGADVVQEDPPEAQAEFSLDSAAYSGQENTNISFTILRSVRTDQTLEVDWAITNASVIPNSGTVVFNPGDASQLITVAAQEVITTEDGDVTLGNPQYISGTFSNPILATPFTATFEVVADVSGTTHFVPIGTSMVAVDAINASPGDAVLFEAGGTFIVSDYDHRLQCQSGVTYGRYGTGNNPIIDGDTAWDTYPAKQRGLIEVANVTDVTVDGLTATGTRLTCFTLAVLSSQDIIIRNCKVFDSLGSGIMMNSWHANSDTTRDVLVELCEVYGMGGDASESFVVMGGSSNIEGRYCWGHDNKKAAWNTKGASSFVEVHHCLFEATNVDPMLYTERADDVEYHHNFLTRSDPTSNLSKPFLSIGLEPLGSLEGQHNRNISYHHNTVYEADDVITKYSIKIRTDTDGELPADVMQNHDIHHNTFHTNSQDADGADIMVNYTDNQTLPGLPRHWDNIMFRDNIVWSPPSAQSLRENNIPGLQTSNNLYQTGKQVDVGDASDVYVNSDPVTDAAGGDFSPTVASGAIGGASDGSDIGSGLNKSDVTDLIPFYPGGIQ